MQNHTNASPTIYNQVRNVLLLGIVITGVSALRKRKKKDRS